MKPLDIGVAKLQPKPESEWTGQLTQAQELTYLLIQRLAITVQDAISEKLLSRLLGLRSPLPLRSRIEHLIQKGALEII